LVFVRVAGVSAWVPNSPTLGTSRPCGSLVLIAAAPRGLARGTVAYVALAPGVERQAPWVVDVDLAVALQAPALRVEAPHAAVGHPLRAVRGLDLGVQEPAFAHVEGADASAV